MNKKYIDNTEIKKADLFNREVIRYIAVQGQLEVSTIYRSRK